MRIMLPEMAGAAKKKASHADGDAKRSTTAPIM